MLSLVKLPFHDSLVLNDAKGGRIWLLEGEAAEAWMTADQTTMAAAVSALGVTENEPESTSRLWRIPIEPPLLDTVVGYAGRTTRVRCWDPRMAEPVALMLAPLTASGPADVTMDLVVDDDRTGVLVNGKLLLDAEGVGDWPLIWGLMQQFRPEREWLVALHAAAVQLDGEAIVLAGQSGSGKTTLAGGLLSAGAALITDEITPVEAGSHAAWPSPFPMSVKEGSWPVFESIHDDFSSASAATRVGRGPRLRYYNAGTRCPSGSGLPITTILFPAWRSGGDTVLRRLHPTETLRMLCDCGAWPSCNSDHLSDLLRWLESVPAYRLSYGDLGEAVPAISALARELRASPRCAL